MDIDFKESVPQKLRPKIRQIIDELIRPNMPDGVTVVRVSRYPGGIVVKRGGKPLIEPYSVRLIGEHNQEIDRYGHHVIHRTDHGLAHMWLASPNRVRKVEPERKAS